MESAGEHIEPNKEPRWFAELDYLRGFAIIAVVMNHVSIFALADKSAEIVGVNLFLITLSGFGVLTFFFISGMVLANKYRSPVPIIGFYKKRLRTIIIPYLVVSTLFIIYLSLFLTAPDLGSIAIFYLTGSASHSLWFIVVLVQFYLFYPFIISIYDRFEKRGLVIWLMVTCLAVQITWNGISVLLVDKLSWIILDRNLLSYLLFFVLGIYATRNIDRVRPLIEKVSWPLLIFLLLISFTATAAVLYACIQTPILGEISVFNFYIITSPAWPALFLACYKISISLSERQGFWAGSIKEIGKASFGIYLFHIFILSAIVAVLVRLEVGRNDLIFYPIALVGLILITYLLVRSIAKMPHSEWFIGR